jgi:hypothetical protein
MKNKKLKLEKMEEQTKSIPLSISIDVCFTFDDDGTILFDEDEMRDAFENKINELTNNFKN